MDRGMETRSAEDVGSGTSVFTIGLGGEDARAKCSNLSGAGFVRCCTWRSVCEYVSVCVCVLCVHNSFPYR